VLHLAHSPGPPLSEFVECFWLLAGAQTPRKERILPSGTIELVINLREDEMRIHDPTRSERYKRFSGAILSGTYSKVFICDAMQHESIVGVHFKPGGAFPFLGVAANELADAHTDLADLWGRSALELRVRLCEVTTPRARFRIMEKFLTERLHHRAVKCHPALLRALNMFGQTGTAATVRDVAHEIGLCQRRFIQLFKAQVGVAPKLFCRLLRFQRARTLSAHIETPHIDRTQRMRQDSRIDWAQLALTCGYFDQSHLINDFEEFSGLSPTEYLRHNQQDGRLKDNHVPLRG
jgi:AraC-like DNA-binding protein